MWYDGAPTFALHSKKNLYGSIPYVIVLPMIGSQWKTIGGSFGFLKRTWLRTLRTTDRATNATTKAPTTSPRPRWATASARGPFMDSRIPISAWGIEGKEKEREGERLWRRSDKERDLGFICRLRMQKALGLFRPAGDWRGPGFSGRWAHLALTALTRIRILTVSAAGEGEIVRSRYAVARTDHVTPDRHAITYPACCRLYLGN